MDQQVSIGLVATILGPLTGAIGVLFWALIGALQARAKRAEDQVDTLVPEVRTMAQSVDKLTTILQAKGP